MSEAERKRRQYYKQNRKRWILIQTVALALVAIIALGSFLIYNRLNRTYYIEYTENSAASYTVRYKDNTFFDKEWIESGQSYVSSLVDEVRADFKYDMNMDTSNVAFDYTYKVTAQLVISDKTTGAHIYDPTDVLIEETRMSVQKSNKFSVNQAVTVDFEKYNALAYQFVNVYGLDNAKSALYITLTVDVLSASDEFEVNNENTHSVSVLVPLGEQNFSIEATESVPDAESKVLACKKNANQGIFLTTSIVSAGLSVLLALLLVAFIYLTKNEDVTYSNKVRKILNSYRSFIQQIHGEFDTTGYQIVPVKTFVELLGIRDTIQSPVLMSENEDETRSCFFIPTNTKILYLFDIKVENYDEIYAKAADDDGSDALVASVSYVEEAAEETAEVVEAVAEPANEVAEPVVEVVAEPVVEIAAEPAGDDEDGDSLIYYDENENKLKIECRRSCLANIIQSENDTVKAYYSELKNYILSFKGVKDRMSWRSESFKKGRNQLFKLKLRGKTICLYCALDPSEFDENKYHHEVADAKAFELVPMLVRIKNPGSLKRAKTLVDTVMAKFEITSDPNYVSVDFVEAHPYERTQALIDRGLIKILVPDGYVVADPRHIVKAEALKEVQETLRLAALNQPVEEISEPEAEPTEEISGTSDDEDGDSLIYYDENENKLKIECRRSCLANIIQSENDTVKAYYSELKNYILSFKGVKDRMSWRSESFKKGRNQLFKLKLRGKTICLYCALDPSEFDENKYHHEVADAKAFELVPMLVRIKNPGSLKRAKTLVDTVMAKFEITSDPNYVSVDFVAAHPYERTQALIDRGLIKILVPDGYVVADPRHIVKAEALNQVNNDTVAKKKTLAVDVKIENYEKAIEDALAEPNLALEDIDYVDEDDKKHKMAKKNGGVEVVSVVWREHEQNNKIYRYDPNGKKLSENDVVLIPATNSEDGTETVKKATIAHGNHVVDPAILKHPFKKIIAVIKHKVEDVLSSGANKK